MFWLCRSAAGLGYGLIVVTNQAGIARGYYSELDFEAVMEFMRGELRAEGVELDAVYYCPFHPEHGVGKYRRGGDGREPGQGGLRRGAGGVVGGVSESVGGGERTPSLVAADAVPVQPSRLL